MEKSIIFYIIAIVTNPLKSSVMKKRFLSILGALLLISIFAIAAEYHNTVNFRAEYKFYFKKDSTIRGYYSDIMYLDVCNSGHSLFYSRNTQYRDSIAHALLSAGMDTYSIMEKLRSYPDGEKWVLDKNYKEQIFKLSKRFITEIYHTESKLNVPNWEIHPDTLTVNGVLCNKATCNIGGRLWKVWFATEIPVNEGPWLLWGLPGLVLKAEEANGYFKFECLDYGKFNDPPQIFLAVLDMPRQKKLSLKDFIKADILFNEDSDTFLEMYMGVYSTYGDKSPKEKYIPLFSPDYK